MNNLEPLDWNSLTKRRQRVRLGSPPPGGPVMQSVCRQATRLQRAPGPGPAPARGPAPRPSWSACRPRGPLLLLCNRPYGPAGGLRPVAPAEGTAPGPAGAGGRLDGGRRRAGHAGARRLLRTPGFGRTPPGPGRGGTGPGGTVPGTGASGGGRGQAPRRAVTACSARQATAGVQVIHLTGGPRRRRLAAGLRPGQARPAALGAGALAFGGLGPRLEARLGTVLQPQRLQAMPQEADAGELLALRVWLLAHRGRLVASSTTWTQRLRQWRQRPLASPLPPDLLERELEALPAEAKLAEAGRPGEYGGRGRRRSQRLLREIGRLLARRDLPGRGRR